MSMRTITLSDRPPVKIEDNNWPVIAQAKDSWHDGQVECQANRKSQMSVRVRQHDDGRAIVYATYDHTSQWASERSIIVRHGRALRGIKDCTCSGDDGHRGPQTTNDGTRLIIDLSALYAQQK